MNSNRLPGLIFKAQQHINGFKVIDITKLNDIGSIAYTMEHIKSGARLIYLNADDEENLFSVAFKTPPFDDTGLPHILEHSVLCGSKKYPVKDPFVELLKSSLATFLNAMTYPDKTVYPCASMNEEDFHNIMRVYCDAVFYPLITNEHFKQEGHHLRFTKLNDIKSDLTIQGVVYNEMKGVYSELDGIIEREESKSLFPDNAYGRDSGGDPEKIANLSYNEFVDFHSKYYHPSNAYIFIYGNFNIEETLQILNDEYLSNFSKCEVDTRIKKQSKFQTPVYKEIPYPVTDDESKTNQVAITINFMTNDITDTITALAMSFLETYLLDNASSPLRKTMVDSKLGEALTSSGYADYQRDTFFTTGLKRIDPANVDKIVTLVKKTCEDIAQNGLDEKRVESTFHRLTFNAREIPSSYPLVLMDRVFNYWLYGKDPLTLLNINFHLEELRRLYETEDRFFEKILEKQIVNNTHYSVLLFMPDNEFFLKKEIAFKHKMHQLKQSMTDEKLKTVLTESKQLEKMHFTPNSPEALATLPKLSISSVSKLPQILNEDIESINRNSVIYTNIYSNDINYINLGFDLSELDENLTPYVSIFREALMKMGAAGYTYAEMAEREAEATGGFGAGLLVDGNFDDPLLYSPYLVVSSKALNNNLENMLRIITDRVTACDFTDLERLQDILLQRRAALRGSILSAGSVYALSYASKDINDNHNASEIFSGITQLRTLNRIIENFDTEKELLISNLKKIQQYILGTDNITTSFIGEKNDRQIFRTWFKHFSDNFNGSATGKNHRLKEKHDPVNRTGIVLPTNIAYNAIAFPCIKATDTKAAALLLLSQYLTYGYLWNEIRTKNGAYGVKAMYATLSGMFGISTYRDPCIGNTFDTFNNIFDHLENEVELDKDQMEQAIIGSIKKLDKPIRPADAATTSLIRHLRNINYEYRKEFRENLLSLNANNVKDVALNYLKNEAQKASICTISGRNNIENANKDFNLGLRLENLLEE